MVRLANQDKMIAALLNDHFAALIAATAYAHSLHIRRIRLAGDWPSNLLLNDRIMRSPITQIQHHRAPARPLARLELARLELARKIAVEPLFPTL